MANILQKFRSTKTGDWMANLVGWVVSWANRQRMGSPLDRVTHPTGWDVDRTLDVLKKRVSPEEFTQAKVQADTQKKATAKREATQSKLEKSLVGKPGAWLGTFIWKEAPMAIATWGAWGWVSWVTAANTAIWSWLTKVAWKVFPKVAAKYQVPLAKFSPKVKALLNPAEWQGKVAPKFTEIVSTWLGKLKSATKWVLTKPDPTGGAGRVIRPIVKKAAWLTATAGAVGGTFIAIDKKSKPAKSDQELFEDLWGITDDKKWNWATSPTTPPTATDQVGAWLEWQNGWQITDDSVINNQNNQSAGGNDMLGVNNTSYNQSNTAPTWWGNIQPITDTTQSWVSITPESINSWYQKMVIEWGSMEATDKFYYDSYRTLNSNRLAMWLEPLVVPPPSIPTDEWQYSTDVDTWLDIEAETDMDYATSSAKQERASEATDVWAIRFNSETWQYEISGTTVLNAGDYGGAMKLMDSFTSAKQAWSGVGMHKDFGIDQDTLNSFLAEVLNWASARFVPSGVASLNDLISLINKQQSSGDYPGAENTLAKLKQKAADVADQLKSRLTPMFKTPDWEIDWDRLRENPIYSLADKVFNGGVKVTQYMKLSYDDIVKEANSLGTTTYTTWYKNLDTKSEKRKAMMKSDPLYLQYLEQVKWQDELLYKQLSADLYSSEITDTENNFLKKLQDVYQSINTAYHKMKDEKWYDAAIAAFPTVKSLGNLVYINYRTMEDDILDDLTFGWLSTSSNNQDVDRMYSNNESGYIQKINSFQGIV